MGGPNPNPNPDPNPNPNPNPNPKQVSSHCSYKYLKKGKYIWMPSLATGSHYEAAKKYFTGEGIHLAGFIQWNRGHGDHDPKARLEA